MRDFSQITLKEEFWFIQKFPAWHAIDRFLLLDAGVDLEAVDMPGANRFVLHVMAAVVEQEARACSERTKAALAAARDRGAKLSWSNPKRIAEQRTASAKGVTTNKLQADAFTDGLDPAVSAFLAQSTDASPTQLAAYLNAQRIPAIGMLPSGAAHGCPDLGHLPCGWPPS